MCEMPMLTINPELKCKKIAFDANDKIGLSWNGSHAANMN